MIRASNEKKFSINFVLCRSAAADITVLVQARYWGLSDNSAMLVSQEWSGGDVLRRDEGSTSRPALLQEKVKGGTGIGLEGQRKDRQL